MTAAIATDPGQLLRVLAQRYIWWKSADEALRQSGRVIAQVMTIGDYDDVCVLARAVGDEVLRGVIRDAEAGQFDERSWHYWHYWLGLAKVDEVPPLPVRKLG